MLSVTKWPLLKCLGIFFCHCRFAATGWAFCLSFFSVIKAPKDFFLTFIVCKTFHTGFVGLNRPFSEEWSLAVKRSPCLFFAWGWNYSWFFFFSHSKSCIHSKRKHSHNKMVEATLNVVKFKVRAKYYRKVFLTRSWNNAWSKQIPRANSRGLIFFFHLCVFKQILEPCVSCLSSHK